MVARRDLETLQASIGHVFTDKALLELALMHVSAVKSGNVRLGSYQRLEFLGDRVLGLAMADLLYRAFPKAEEGELSRRLSDLVRKETCCEVAIGWNLGPYLKLGGGEVHSGGRKKMAILADSCEAIIGAIFLDAGFEAARAAVVLGWGDRVARQLGDVRDSKTMLQEWVQGQGLPTPVYREVSRAGPDHRLEFVVAAVVPGLGEAEGSGFSKREAEQAAAAAFLLRMRDGGGSVAPEVIR